MYEGLPVSVLWTEDEAAGGDADLTKISLSINTLRKEFVFR